jgi:hypothetical protein
LCDDGSPLLRPDRLSDAPPSEGEAARSFVEAFPIVSVP